MAPSPPLQLAPGARIGHYTVEWLISSGGFGAVYRVTRDGQRFALKLPLGRAASDEGRKVTEARIAREVVSLMTLSHPGIVGVRGFDRWPDPVTGALYVVMDFVDGVPMTEWRATSGCTLRQMVEVFAQLARAVEAMHAMGVVHRDIKSANCLVSRAGGSLEAAPRSPAAADATSFVRASHSPAAAPRSAAAHEATSFDRAAHSTGSAPRTGDATAETTFDREGGAPAYRPVLVDFGLARPTFTPDVTAEHVLVGTEGRWAPELFTSAGPHFQYTPATDLYALGHLLFEVLTGVPPPRSHTVTAPRPAPSVLAAGLLPALDPIVLGLLAASPDARTPSAGVLAGQLEAVLADTTWGDAAPLPRWLFRGKGLDLEGQFVTRAEGGRTPPTADAPPPDATADCARPTLPLFVLDSIDTLEATAPRPARPVGPPYPVRDLRGLRRLDAMGTFFARSLSVGVNVLLMVTFALLAALAVWTWVVPRGADAREAPAPDADLDALLAEPAAKTPPVVRTRPGAPAPGVPAPTPAVRAVRPPLPMAAPLLVRAALVGHAKPGPARAVLRQPVQLGSASLPTGTALDGTVSELPDGRFLLRFDSVQRADGSALPLNAAATLGAAAGRRHPLTPGASPPSFEFDLSVTPSR